MRNQRHAKFLLGVALVLLAGLVLVSIAQAHTTGPHVRIAHLAPDMESVDIYVNDTAVVSGAKFGDVSKYTPIVGWKLSVVAVPAGGKLSESLTKEPLALDLPEGDLSYYTIAVVGSTKNGNFALVVLPKDGPPPQSTASATMDMNMNMGGTTAATQNP